MELEFLASLEHGLCVVLVPRLLQSAELLYKYLCLPHVQDVPAAQEVSRSSFGAISLSFQDTVTDLRLLVAKCQIGNLEVSQYTLDARFDTRDNDRTRRCLAE